MSTELICPECKHAVSLHAAGRCCWRSRPDYGTMVDICLCELNEEVARKLAQQAAEISVLESALEEGVKLVSELARAWHPVPDRVLAFHARARELLGKELYK